VLSAVRYVFSREDIVYHDVMVDRSSVDKLSSLCRDYKMALEMYELGTKK
jgi:hypothetical protein